MHTLQFSILFSLLLFGAYSEYRAETVVKTIKSEEKNRPLYNHDIRNEDIGFLDSAVKLSRNTLSHDDSNAVGSVVVKNGKIVGEGWNKTKQRHDPSAHAVVEAIRDASKNLASTELVDCYIYISARPCAMCSSLINLAGIKRIYYSAPGEEVYSSKSDGHDGSDFHEFTMPRTGRHVPAIPVFSGDVSKNNQ